MRRARPKQHYRTIKTKHGRKQVLINKGIKAGKVKRRMAKWDSPEEKKKIKNNVKRMQVLDYSEYPSGVYDEYRLGYKHALKDLGLIKIKNPEERERLELLRQLKLKKNQDDHFKSY